MCLCVCVCVRACVFVLAHVCMCASKCVSVRVPHEGSAMRPPLCSKLQHSRLRHDASHSTLLQQQVATRRRAVQHDPLRRIRDGRCAPEDVQREKARQLESWDRWVAEQVMRTF